MQKWISRAAIVWAGVAVIGCGGSSSSTNTTHAATQVVSVGTITGLGSVVVNGVRFNDDSATITVNDQPATSADLKVGMVVEVEGSASACPNADAAVCEGLAARIRFRNNLEGPITSIDVPARSLTVMGRDVGVDDSTVFEGSAAGDLSGLSIGDMVSVSGLEEQSRLRARWVRRASPFENGVTPVMVHGVIANLDATQATCTVDGIAVRFQGLPSSELPAGGVADGQHVQALGRNYGGGVMTADRIQLRDRLNQPDGSRVELEGFVSGFASVAEFFVGGQQVDATGALFRNGTATDLRDGTKVEIEGTMVGSLLVASKVIFRLEVSAQIVAPLQRKDADNAAFVVLGQTVVTTPLTQFLDSSGPGGRATPTLAYADLAVSDRVDVRAYQDTSGRLVAMRVERTDPDPLLIAKGPVIAKTPVTGFSLLGIGVTTGPATRYRDALSNLISDVAFYDSLAVTPGAATVVRTQGVASTANLETIDATRAISMRGEVEISR